MLQTAGLTLAALAMGIIATAMLAIPHQASSAPRYDVYFVAIGSSNYAASTDPDVHSLSPIDGANHSAKLVADRLVSGGARYGVVLTSRFGAYVSLNDIETALRGVAARMVQDHPASPLFLFYFAGHGMAEGVGWNHFSIPGDFAYTGEPDQLGAGDLARYTLHAGSLGDELDRLHVPYLVILDTCSEGRPARFDSPVLTAQASSGLEDVASALRVLNEFRQESPVIFSAAPGRQVSTAPDPTDPDPKANPVAPMARRMVLLLDAAAKVGQPLTLGEIVRGLASPSLDQATGPGVTHATPGPSWNGVLFLPGAANGRLDELSGDADGANICCQSGPQAAEEAAAGMTGLVRLNGDVGEFISGGGSRTLASPTTSLSLTDDDGDVTVQAGDDENGLTLSFAAPKGQTLAVGTYSAAQRDSFQDDGHPGLSITSASRACNTVAGGFTIDTIERNAAGRITRLQGTFRQLCDDNQAWLSATIDLRGTR